MRTKRLPGGGGRFLLPVDRQIHLGTDREFARRILFVQAVPALAALGLVVLAH